MKEKILLVLCICIFIFPLSARQKKILTGSISTVEDSYFVASVMGRFLSQLTDSTYRVFPEQTLSMYNQLRQAKKDGSEIVIFHDMFYLSTATGASPEIYKTDYYRIGPRIVQNPVSGWICRSNARFNNLVTMCEYLKGNSSRSVRMTRERGGVSQIAFDVFYDWVVKTYGSDVAQRIKTVEGGSTSKNLCLLYDNEVDVIFADYTSVEGYITDRDAKVSLKMLAVLSSCEEIDVPSYSTLGITDPEGNPFDFVKDFVIYYPKDVSQDFVDRMDKICFEICHDPGFIRFLTALHYKSAYLNSDDASEYILKKQDEMIKLSHSLTSK